MEQNIYDWYQSATKNQPALKEDFYDAIMRQLPVADLTESEKTVATKSAAVLKANIKTSFG